MSQSLESLAKTMKAGDFSLLRQHFSSVPDQVFKKLTKKDFFHTAFWTASKNLMNRCLPWTLIGRILSLGQWI